jgi:hypothetical protein
LTLIVRDEKGKVVSEVNPIITEHNGTIGDTVTLPFTIENTSKHHFHRDVAIQVSTKPPVDATLNLPTAPNPEFYGPRIEIRRINPLEKFLFNLRTTVKAETPEQVLTGTSLQITSLRFPMA